MEARANSKGFPEEELLFRFAFRIARRLHLRNSQGHCGLLAKSAAGIDVELSWTLLSTQDSSNIECTTERRQSGSVTITFSARGSEPPFDRVSLTKYLKK